MNSRIALLGTSLAVESLAAVLEGIPGLELLRCIDTTEEGLASVKALTPDAVVFDIALEVPERSLLDLLRQAGLLLVRYDVANQQMLLLSGRPARLSTVDDLVRVLSGRESRHKKVE